MSYHEHLANLSLWFWTETANHLWQSTLFLLLIFLIVAVLGKAAAKSRYTVWLLASVKFVLPLSAFAAAGQWLNLNGLFSSAASVVELPAPEGINLVNLVSSAPGVGAMISTTEIANGHHEIFCFLTFVWLFGCFSLLLLWLKRSRVFKTSLGYRNTPTTEREAELLNNAQVKIGLTSRVSFVISDSILEPVVLGIWQPIIVMPKGLSQKLTDDEFESVLMHELAHVARRDNLVGVLQMALCCLLWFHPLVWLIKRKLLEERERACDEVVVRHENKPQVYASGLLKVVQYGLYPQQSAGIANAASANLNKRLELIMKNNNENTKNKWQKWIVGSAFGILILTCVFAGLATTQARSVNNIEPIIGSNNNNLDKAELIRQIETSPNVPYRVVGNDDSPLKITEAAGKEITSSQYTKLTGWVMVRTQGEKEVSFPNVNSVPEIKMVNTSGKTITGYMVAIIEPESPLSSTMKWRSVGAGKVFDNFPKISIALGETFTINRTSFVPPPTVRVNDGSGKSAPKATGLSEWEAEKNWLVGFTDKSNFYVSVAQVSFDDGTKWTAKQFEK